VCVFITSQRVAMCVFLCGGSDLCWVFCLLLGGGGIFNGLWVLRRVSKIVLGNIVWLSFKWVFAVNSAWM
jgi:hypothetical protein